SSSIGRKLNNLAPIACQFIFLDFFTFCSVANCGIVKLIMDFKALFTTSAENKSATITTTSAATNMSLYIFPDPMVHSDTFVVVSAANNNVFINLNFYAMIGHFPL